MHHSPMTPHQPGMRKAIRVFMMDFLCVVPYYTLRLCQSLAHPEFSVTLASPTYDLDPGCFRRGGIKNDPGPLDITGKRRIQRPSIRRFLKLVECCVNMIFSLGRFVVRPPKIVHVQYAALLDTGLPFEVWLLKIVKSLGIHTVLTVHNLLPHDTGDRYRPAFGRLYRLMDLLICHTAETRDRLVSEFQVIPQKVRVIPHGPLFHDVLPSSKETARRSLGVRDDICLVLYQGFIKRYKGIPFLLEAWRSVQAMGLDAQLVIAGGGEEELLQEIEDTVKTLGIDPSVRLHLRYLEAHEVSSLYQAADVVVYPYRHITTSGALMTGIAMRKTIVATALPAFEEVLENGRNAVLINYGDVDGLAASLARLIVDPARRAELVAELPAFEETAHSWSAIADQTRQCYWSLVTGDETVDSTALPGDANASRMLSGNIQVGSSAALDYRQRRGEFED